MSKAFEANNVSITFGGTVKALSNVTLSAEEGSIFGLLGPNGAGKTTLVRMLTTLLEPHEGSLRVLGLDVQKQQDEVRKVIGLAGQYAAVDEFLTGRENLHMVGSLYHLSRAETKKRAQQILEEFSLTEAADRPVKTYSGGMRRRLDLGASLVGKPKMLFLDEPTTGLDPRTRLELWHVIRELVKSGTSILLTTQYLDEADELADRMAVIDHGKVIAEGTSKELKKQLGGDVVELILPKGANPDKVVQLLDGVATKKINVEDNSLRIPVKDGSKGLIEVVRILDKAKIAPNSISLHQPSLDDVFLTLTGEKAKDQTVPQKSRKPEKMNV